ncbi:MAG TPA: hypothetical protein VN521_08000, partial [Negativicutes bacterium]|nr:hypothetical protein [Negativicutes bacterium]
EAESRGLQFVPLPQEVAAALKSSPKLAAAGINVGSYLDIPDVSVPKWQAAADVLSRYDYADMYLFVIADPFPGVENVIIDYAAKIDAPVAVAYMGGGEAEKAGRLAMQTAGIPVYPTPERAARGLAALAWYAQYRRDSNNA